MKIKGWIIYGLLVSLAIASRGVCSETMLSTDTLNAIEQSVAALKSSATDTTQKNTWEELNQFQSLVWRAMALDPSPIYAVPISQVPKNLFAAELNLVLEQKAGELKSSGKAAELHVQPEFDQYMITIDNLIRFRKLRQFPQARAISKRGLLDSQFEALSKKIAFNQNQEHPQNENAELNHLSNLVHSIKEQTQNQLKETQKKELFNNGNQFIGFALAAILGFFLGIAGYRAHPDFFQNFMNKFESTPPTATTHPAGNSPLDYARWLKEFEEILSRLKSSQLTHERRIEEITNNSEKITQHALSLYSDARIKNEANLEYRMSSLLREIQNQFEQSQKLKAGERIQMSLMLEHCLALCDGIESNSIVVNKSPVPGTAIGSRVD